jgi:drug/metabolite transporter (DMT)-like permease
MTRRGAVLFAALCVVWGIPYLLIKVAVSEVSPVALVFLRTGIATVLLLPLAFARGEVRPVLARWRPLLAYTAVEIAAPWVLLSDAERHLTSSLSGLLVSATPLVGVGLALLRPDGDRVGRVGLLGLVIGLAGVAALVGLDVHGTQAVAVLEVAGVAVGYATGPIIMAGPLRDLPTLGVVATSLGLCAVAYAPFAAPALPRHWPRGSVLASVLLLAVVCTALAFLLMFGLVAEVGPVRATVITYVNPAVAVAAGVVILDEPLTAATVVGFVLVIAGSFLATRRRPARTPPLPGDAQRPDGGELVVGVLQRADDRDPVAGQ